ncbi:hypothetical protein ACI7YT_09125 [Microbacterium sp. M]|uniref:hypothetical protein n=1 Tax=Microbacterium sp. M TaxID=3377125 RepID=UPI00386933A4
MLSKGLGRVLGRANELIHNRAAQHLPELVGALLDDALARWASNGWHTFNHLESNCSGQLYRWLLEARRADRRFYTLEVVLENVLLTPGMLAGTASVTTAKRPDIRIHVRETGVLLEAKRLTDTAAHCRAYVDDGMVRFVNERYGAAEDWGMMIGYVQESSTAGIEPRINGFVTAHALMGAGHELIPETTSTHSERLRSSHPRASGAPIRLDHVWVVLH